MNPEAIDMATALEISFNDPLIEAKFQAVKSLHAKKIKSLMGSIDALQKEVAKQKVLGKDNRRSQMIQALKKKIRDLELVIEVLKSEICNETKHSSACIQTREQINDLIIKQTISGPKRFRPLTREEIERQLSEMDKKMKKLEIKGPQSGSAPPSRSGSSLPIKVMSDIRPETSTGDKSSDVMKIAHLTEELQYYRTLAESKDESIRLYQEDITRLRARNAELRVRDEEMDLKEREYRNLEEDYREALSVQDDLNRRLLESQEECFSLKAEAELDHHQHEVECSALQEQCERLLKQNSSLLKKLTDMETQLVNKTASLSAGNTAIPAVNPNSSSSAAHQLLELKIGKLQEKLKASEEKVQSLTRDLEKTTSLRDNLRNKNEEVRELKRTVAELQRLATSAKAGFQEKRDLAEAKEGKLVNGDGDGAIRSFTNAPYLDRGATSVSAALHCCNALVEYLHSLMELAIEDGMFLSPPASLSDALEDLLKENRGKDFAVDLNSITKLVSLISVMTEHYDEAVRNGYAGDDKYT